MAPIDEHLATLNDAEKRISAQNSRIARAEVEKEQAQAVLAQTKEALKAEFGISTGTDVKRVQSELEAELAAAVERIMTELEAAGA
jgi:adenylyl- and sulfurtransferase ThiI